MLGIRAAAYAGIVLWGMRKILRKVLDDRKPVKAFNISSEEFLEAYNRNIKLYQDDCERLRKMRDITEEEHYGTLEKPTGCSIRYYISSDGKANFCEMPNAYQGIHSIQVQCLIQKSRIVR